MSTELILSSFLFTSLKMILKKTPNKHIFSFFFCQVELNLHLQSLCYNKRFLLTFYINILVGNLQLYDVHARFFPRSTKHTGKVA